MPKFDRIVVIDIECTCWRRQPPPGQESEIIEIGVATLDLSSLQPLQKESILVKPERSTVSPFCTELTTLTPAQVKGGISLKSACTQLRKEFQTSDRIWASYGDYDRNQFQKQCQAREIRYPFGPRHINVKTLFALLSGLPKEVGMARALELLELPLIGTHHRGDDDAWNIAHILARILQTRAIDIAPRGTEKLTM